MASDKFKGCFIDDSDLYTYDIEYDSELIAKAHTLSAKDKSIIEKNSMTKQYKSGEMVTDFDTQAMITYWINQAVTEWQLPKPKSLDTISMLSQPFREHLFNAIQEHEQNVAKITEDTEKNS